MYTITDVDEAITIRATLTSGAELEEFIAKLVVRASEKQWDLGNPELNKIMEDRLNG